MSGLASMTALLKSIYDQQRIETMVYDDSRGFPLEYYLHAGPVTPLRISRSKSRQRKWEQAKQVAQDVLHQAGVWPFKRADWFPDLRTRDETAQDIIGRGLLAMLPMDADQREAVRVQLEAKGLLGTPAAQRFLAHPITPPLFYGVDRTGSSYLESIYVRSR